MESQRTENAAFFSGKRVLLTGACGTIGRELARQLIEDLDVAELIALDNNESELFFLEQAMTKCGHARAFLADVRDRDELRRRMAKVDIVFHTAAFKHVFLSERSPLQAVQTNILGVQNVVSAAQDNGVQKVIFTSSDKAVNPTSVMGTSKLMGERLMTAANSNIRASAPVFASTRFGNVLGSRGSVIPIFREQIRRGGPVTLTDRRMSRFIMNTGEAVRLVIDSARLAQGGEVFVTKMPTIRIEDLAEAMIHELAGQHGFKPEDIQTEEIGCWPGEKMYEELLNDEEIRRTWELERYFVVLPAFTSLYREIDYQYADLVTREVTRPYNSANETPFDQEELIAFLNASGLLVDETAGAQQPPERFRPGSASD